MVRHVLVRRSRAKRAAVAVAASVALAAGLSPALSPASAAEAPRETVVPAALRYDHLGGRLLHNDPTTGRYGAGEQGFFHSMEGHEGTVWTRYSDGRTVPAPPQEGVTSVKSTSSDILAYRYKDGRIVLWNAADGTTRTFRLPEGHTDTGVSYGTTAVSAHDRVPGDTTSRVFHLWAVGEDGAATGTEVTGVPAGMRLGMPRGADDESILFVGRLDGTTRIVEVDRATGRVRNWTRALPTDYYYAQLSPAHIVLHAGAGRPDVLVVPRTDLSADPVTVTLPGDHAPASDLTVVGDWLVHRPASAQAVQAVPIAGGAPVTLLGVSDSGVAATPAGAALAVGRTPGMDDWGVHRIRPGAGGGAPVVEQVKSLGRPPIPIQGLSLDHGRLVVAEYTGPGLRHDFVRTVAATGTPEFGERSAFRPSGFGMGGCPGEGGTCTPIHGMADGRVAWLESGTPPHVSVRADGAGEYDGWERTTLPEGGRITDVSGEYLIYATPKLLYVQRAGDDRVAWPEGASRVARPATVLRAAGAAALSGDLLWTAGRTPGSVTAYNLSTRKTTETLTTDAGCEPTELQALGRWLYWTCDGRAGVYDRTARKSVPVPAHEAKLGDGYVVTHDRRAGKLTLTTVTGGAPASRVIGDLPDTGVSQRDLRWTVDESGPNAAYVDAQERVHLVPSGVPQQPLRPLEAARNAASVTRREHDTVPGTLTTVLLSKPSASWRLTVRSEATGKVVDTRDGGAARGLLSVGWHGNQRVPTGEAALPAGSYDWTLSVAPADGVGAPLEVRGTVRLVR
ncbi:hypothetical protein SUDANB58_02752 [Streptomyces sp. enrichment culture]|uniref:FG-GAP repeat domain-containing protein n=1 Tax=Streptomyces sp. enrichment culture TaxID=1795815 RepID=UPI003F56B6AF